MKVLQVITDNDRRGAQVFARDLGQALGARGHDVETVALAAGTATASLGFDVVGGSRLDPRAQLRLRRRVAGADVVVAHGSATAQATTISLARTRTPVVYRQISDSVRWAPTWVRRTRVRLYLRQMAHVVALHRGAADTLRTHLGVAPDRITVVPNGVVAADFAHPANRPARARPVALYLGALVPEKGVRVLLALARACPDLDVVVCGSGPLEGELRREAPDNLRVVGSTDDPAAVLQDADLFVFPSSWGDSMPAVLIEAGLSGLPVVATDVGAARDVVVDGTSGTIVPPDDEAAFVAAVRALLDRPRAELVAAGQAGAAHCRAHFDIDVVAGGWEAVLADVVRSRSTAGGS